MLDGAFFDIDDLAGLMYEVSTRAAVSKKVLETLSVMERRVGASAFGANGGGDLTLAWDELEGSDREGFLDVLVRDDAGTRLDLLSSDISKLGLLPIWETLSGTYVPLGNNNTASPGSVNDNYTLGGDLKFEEVVEFLPEVALARLIKDKGDGALMKDLNVLPLTESIMILHFVLPAFDVMPQAQKLSFLTRLKAKWETLKDEESLKSKMKATKCVLRGGADLGEWVLPSSLYDPTHTLLSVIYRDDRSRFPSEEMSSEGWLMVWRDLDMVKTVDRPTFMACARTVESERSVEKAAVLHSYFKENFSDFYEPQFARELGKVTFVPAVQYHHGGPEATGAAAGSVMLVKYENVVVAKDANLAFTQMPMLAESACPPQVMYSNLGIMSPPPITVVLAHLRTLVDNGAWLNDWDFTGDGPIAVFSSIFKYLEDKYDKLSPRIKEALSSTALIPVGSSLIEPRRMFFRLSMNLQPLLFELPRWCNGYATLFENIGVRETPSDEDYRTCLVDMAERVGDRGVLDPNELAAVLKLMKLLGEAGGGRGARQGGVVFGVDDRGLLIDVKGMLYNDAPWLLARLNRSLVRLCHPRVTREIAERLKVRKMSEWIIETLGKDDVQEIDEQPGRIPATQFTGTVQSSEFEAVLRGMVLGEGGDTAFSFDSLRSMQVKYVGDLATRLVLRTAGGRGKDVTAPGARGGDTAHFYDRRSNAIFIAINKLPESLPASLIVAMSVCDVVGLGREHVSTISAVVGVRDMAEVGRLKEVLRFGGGGGSEVGGAEVDRASNGGSTLVDQAHRGEAGKVVSGYDEGYMCIKPVKDYGVGEVVAWRNGDGVARYATVSEVGDGEEGTVRKLRIDIGAGENRELLTSEIFAFDGVGERRVDFGTVSGESGDTAGDEGEIDIGEWLNNSLLAEGSSGAKQTGHEHGNSRSDGKLVGTVSQAAAVKAASEILARAGINLKSDVMEMAEQAMAMKEEKARVGVEVGSIKQRAREIGTEIRDSTDEALICPITRGVFEDPVVAADGFTYERSAIEQWLRANSRSPQTNQPLPHRNLVPNITLRAQIEALSDSLTKLDGFLETI